MTQPLQPIGVRAVFEGLQQYEAQFGRFQRATAGGAKSAQTASTSFAGMAKQGLAIAAAFAGVHIGIGTLNRALRGTIGAAVDFESSFAGVRKTVDATEEEFQAIARAFRDMAMEIPVNVNELNRIGEAAGQLGIEAESIVGFTRVMADLGVTTNLSSDQAATALARLANITQLPQDQFDRLGSTIVDLGNNMATTESEIVDFGLRIAGAGHQIGLTEAQILAFGAALSSVGINAEAGGTAISRVFVEIDKAVRTGGESLEEFARVAGMSSEQFVRAYKEDAAGAIVTFIEGLGDISAAGGDVFGVLEDLELGNIRVRDALLRAAGAGDLMRDSLNLASSEWEANTALTEEANKRYETAAAQFTILRNKLNDLAIDIGAALIPALLATAEFLEAEVIPRLERFTAIAISGADLIKDNWSTIRTVLGPVFTWFGLQLEVISGALDALASLLEGDWSNAWRGWANVAIAVLEAILTPFVATLNTMAKAYNETVARLPGLDEIPLLDVGSVIPRFERVGEAATRTGSDFKDLAIASSQAKRGADDLTPSLDGLGGELGDVASAAADAYGELDRFARQLVVMRNTAILETERALLEAGSPAAFEDATSRLNHLLNDLGENLQPVATDVGTAVGSRVGKGVAAGIEAESAGAIGATDAMIAGVLGILRSSRLANEFGDAGGAVVEAFLAAVTEPTEAAGDRLADAIGRLFEEAERRGVVISEDAGNRLLEALARGIEEGTPEAIAAAEDAIRQITDTFVEGGFDAVGAFRAALSEIEADRELEARFGRTGKRLWDALVKAIEDETPSSVAAMASAADALLQALDDGLSTSRAQSLGSALMTALTGALEAGGGDLLAALNAILAEIGAALGETSALPVSPGGGREPATVPSGGGGGAGGGGIKTLAGLIRLAEIGKGVFISSYGPGGEPIFADAPIINEAFRSVRAGVVSLADLRGAGLADVAEAVAASLRRLGLNVNEFASGGVVPGPEGLPQLAIVHGGEVVLPSSAPRGDSGGLTIDLSGGTFTGTPEENGEAIADAVLQVLREQAGTAAFAAGIRI